MSEEKPKDDKEKKPTTDTTGQPVTTPTTQPPTETPTTAKIEIIHTHRVEGKPTDVPPAETSTEKPVEKTAETPKVETPAEKELRETKEKLEEREGQLTVIALKEFESQKTAFLDLIKDPEKRVSAEKMIGDDPDKLTSAQMMAQIMISGIRQAGGEIKGELVETPKPAEKPETKPEDDGTSPVPNSGKVKALPPVPTGGDAKEIAKKSIDEVYAILADPSKSQEEKRIANEKANDFYKQFRAGALAGGAKDSYPLPVVMQCPKCNATMVGYTCQTCKYEVPQRQRGSVFGK